MSLENSYYTSEDFEDNLYTIKEIKRDIIKLPKSYKLLTSTPDKDNIYLVFGTNHCNYKNLRILKVCWSNNTLRVKNNDKIKKIKMVDIMIQSSINENSHLFEIVKMENEITEQDCKYIYENATEVKAS